MKTISEIVKLSADFLQKKGIELPKRQAEEIIADALDIKRMQLFLEYDRPLNALELDLCRKNLARRAEGEPAPYIRGFVEFSDCKIEVNKNVLIPRAETEILVENITQILKEKDLSNKSLWDICTGSGCIGIALKKRFPKLKVSATDISELALQVAKQNAERNETSINYFLGDLLKPLKNQKADFLVCNPPYISEKEYFELDREVRDFEPKNALLAGIEGIEIYRTLASELPQFLNPGALVWLEIGWNQGQAVRDLFKGPIWKVCKLEQDWAGHDRFISLEIE